jgi:integrase
MSNVDFTIASPSDKSKPQTAVPPSTTAGLQPSTTARSKPAKPSPDYPLTAHPAGYWCKKIKGKLHYFGRWEDPEAALRAYQDLLAGNPVEKPAPAQTRQSDKPDKQYPSYPLSAHPAGQWCKRIRTKLYYFGPWSDPDGALAEYQRQKDDLEAGRTPRADPEALTVKQLANHYLFERQKDVDAGTLAVRTWRDYRAIMEMLVQGLGARKLVLTLSPQDFSDLKKKLAKRNSPARISTVVQVIRSAFKFAADSDVIDKPVRFGPMFKRTSKKTLRIERGRKGAKLFTADEIRRLIEAAQTQVGAMILLGINCGHGNTDCGRLPIAAIDFDNGIIDFPRPKTGIARRCVLWPETLEAIRAALACRPEAKKPEDAGLVFVTKYGHAWANDTNAGPLVWEMKKLLKELGINGRHRLGFYTLRHTFRTVADEAKDQPACDYAMGHESPHMSSHYRETISDERLRAVVNHVHKWLFGSEAASGRKTS